MAKKSPLGKGLGALIDNSQFHKKSIKDAVSTGDVAEIDILKIELNPFQPRTEFDEVSLQELKSSIELHGIIQPITVRKLANNKFQLISGERRLRASKLLSLKKIIAFVRDANDQEMLEIALIENIQREDLNSIEIAISYQRLIDECNLTQDKLGDRVGKNRSTVSNYLRLLKLPAEIQSGVQKKTISMGHAKVLMKIEDSKQNIEAYENVVKNKLSVRETEKFVNEILLPTQKISSKKKIIKLPEEYISFKNKLATVFQSNVTIKRNNAGKGSLTIPFTSDEDFKKIQKLLSNISK